MAAGDFVQALPVAIHAGTDATALVVTIGATKASSGNTLVALYGCQQATDLTSIVNSIGSDTWNVGQEAASNGANEHVSLSTCQLNADLTTGATITLTPAGSVSAKVAIIIELQGHLTFEGSSSGSNTLGTAGTAMTVTGGGATSQAANVYVGAVCLPSTVTQASEAATGYTNEGNVRSASGTIREVAVLYEKVNAIQTPSCAMTWTGSSAGSGVLGVLKIPGGAPVVVRELALLGVGV